MQIGPPTVEISMDIPQKVKIELPSGPAIPLVGIYPKDSKSAYLRDA